MTTTRWLRPRLTAALGWEEALAAEIAPIVGIPGLLHTPPRPPSTSHPSRRTPAAPYRPLLVLAGLAILVLIGATLRSALTVVTTGESALLPLLGGVPGASGAGVPPIWPVATPVPLAPVTPPTRMLPAPLATVPFPVATLAPLSRILPPTTQPAPGDAPRAMPAAATLIVRPGRAPICPPSAPAPPTLPPAPALPPPPITGGSGPWGNDWSAGIYARSATIGAPPTPVRH